jgi:hypothetical protein
MSATILSSDDGIGHFSYSFRTAQLQTLQVNRQFLRQRQITGIKTLDPIH